MAVVELQFQAESGAPVVLRTTYKNKRYLLKLNVSVMGVSVDESQEGPGGLPVFNVNAAPVMAVEEAK